ncbi:MAG: hypothetical protein WCP93_02500 [Candidatus Berkelbacteria bacterium]
MIRFKALFAFVLLVTLMVTPFGLAQADENQAGGNSSNLWIKDNRLQILTEDINLKMHVGYTEIEQNFTLKNPKNQMFDASFSLPYSLNFASQGIDNITVLVDSQVIQTNQSKQTKTDPTKFYQNFLVRFNKSETKHIKISYWQLNSTNLRGFNTFFYELKDKLTNSADKFNINLTLMDGLNLQSFDKTLNPDLDLKLEPFGYTVNGRSLTWSWSNFTPGFNLAANFYWPKADLARINNLKQSKGLYNVTSLSNSDQAANLVDSSYLTSWQSANPSETNQPWINFNFDQTRTLDTINIIPGIFNQFSANGRPKDIQLFFDNNVSETITLTDSLQNQNFKLVSPVTTKNVKIQIDSVYAGQKDKNNFNISEVEFGSSLEPVLIKKTVTPTQVVTNSKPTKTNWFISTFQDIINLIKAIFKE